MRWFHCQTLPNNLSKSWKTRKRRTEDSSEICTTTSPLHIYARLLFHFSCKKRLQMNWKGSLLIFSSMLFYRSTSIHLSQYSSAQINHALQRDWVWWEIYIFNLSIKKVLFDDVARVVEGMEFKKYQENMIIHRMNHQTLVDAVKLTSEINYKAFRVPCEWMKLKANLNIKFSQKKKTINDWN